MNHGTIIVCESVGVTASQRTQINGMIFVAKAAPKFRFTIYGSYFIDRPLRNDVEVKVTNRLDTERILKFMVREVTAEQMAIRGVDHFILNDQVLPTVPGKYWFDLIVNKEIVSSTCVTVIP